MSLPSFSLQRPVFAIVLNIVIVLFGLIGLNFLGVREYPSVDPPVISVRTNYSGASADIIEAQITEPLEKAINSVQGIRNISSSSNQGNSNITVEFDLNADLETAANDVRDKVSQATRQLPQDIDAPPVVSKADANSEAIISMTVQSTTKNQLELSEFASTVLQERLQTIPGVSGVQIWGEKKYAMRLLLDPIKMAAYHITPTDVSTSLSSENIDLPTGKIAGLHTELTIKTSGRLETEEDFNNMVIKNGAQGIIKFKDIGKAILGPENDESILKESGTPMIALAIVPQPGANYVEIADEFYKRYHKIKNKIPKDIQLNIALDNTIFVKKSLVEVQETILIAFGLVVIIIFLFFRNWLIAIRPLIDIPVSLIGTFFIMYVAGFTINVLTLLGIVLATGLVVDDGIVVTENIFKKLEQGMDKHKAALLGSNEIYFAVIATSITLAIVFLPIIFLQGFVGSLFKEFGVVVAGAVLISAVVSLTLTPVLNVYLSSKTNNHGVFFKKTEGFYRALDDVYHKALSGFLKIRWVAFVILIICLGLTFIYGKQLKSELAPLEDRNYFRMIVSAPEGTSYPFMDNYMNELGGFLKDSIPENKVLLSVTSPSFTGSGSSNSGFFRIKLKDAEERERSQQDIVDMVNLNISKYNFGKAFAMQDQTISSGTGRFGLPVQFVIQNNDFNKIKEVLPLFLAKANESKVFQGVDVNLKFNKPEIYLDVNRVKAAELGVTVENISQTLQFALSERRIGYFILNDKQYQVIGEIEKIERDKPADLDKIYLKNNSGQMLQLSSLVTAKEQSSPPQLYHFNRYKSATISANVANGYTLNDGIEEMKNIGAKVLDESFSTDLSGPSRDLEESSSNTLFAFLLALVLIYLVLAAQFESFKDPIIIMITVPLAITGAVISLYLFNQSLNIFSQIGIIMLVGLVTKNGILIVEFANHLRESGDSKIEAVIKSATSRMRPIIMTSLATALGALPIALALGAGAQSRIPLGIVIIGGIMFSLILTLFVIPAMYIFISGKKKLKQDEQSII